MKISSKKKFVLVALCLSPIFWKIIVTLIYGIAGLYNILEFTTILCLLLMYREYDIYESNEWEKLKGTDSILGIDSHEK